MTQHKSSSMLQHYLSLYVLRGAHCVGSSLPCVLHHGCKINSIQSVKIIERRTKTNEPVSILSLDIQVGYPNYPWISILHNSSLDSISVNGALTSPLPLHTLSWQDTPHPMETYTNKHCAT